MKVFYTRATWVGLTQIRQHC